MMGDIIILPSFNGTSCHFNAFTRISNSPTWTKATLRVPEENDENLNESHCGLLSDCLVWILIPAMAWGGDAAYSPWGLHARLGWSTMALTGGNREAIAWGEYRRRTYQSCAKRKKNKADINDFFNFRASGYSKITKKTEPIKARP